MRIDILTLFPEMFESFASASMIGRAVKNGILDIRTHNIRDYSEDKHKKADDYPFGGGRGMLMMPQPVFSCMEALDAYDCRCIYMSPRGKIIDKGILEELAGEERIVFLAGHYEGVDQRVLDYWGFTELSIGDYILTGGELPVMVAIDALSRFVPGVLGDSACAEEESIYSGLLECSQYTQPRNFRGHTVPEVLCSGDHKRIALRNFEDALRITEERRKDLLEAYLATERTYTKDERKILEKILGFEV